MKNSGFLINRVARDVRICSMQRKPLPRATLDICNELSSLCLATAEERAAHCNRKHPRKGRPWAPGDFHEDELQVIMLEIAHHTSLREWVVHGYAIPNQADVSVASRGRLVRSGMKRGVSDLRFDLVGGRGFYVEVKRPKGKPSEGQPEFLTACNQTGHPAYVARSVVDFAVILTCEVAGVRAPGRLQQF